MITRLLASAACALALTGFAQQAQAEALYVRNNTPHAIWYTVYNAAYRTQKKDWGCVLPNQEIRLSRSEYGRIQNIVYILGEIKESATSCGKNSNKWTIGPTMLTLNNQGRAMLTWIASGWNEKPSVNNSAWH